MTLDDARKVERVDPPGHGLREALDDLAAIVHLPHAALGVLLRLRHDRDVLDTLTAPRADVKTVTDHDR